MDAKGIVGTVFVVPTVLGTEGYWTLAQCQEAYANGWAISNHAYDHANLTELSQAACQANLEACRDYLIANGMPRAANYMAHPGGQRNATVDAAAVAAGVIIARSVRVGSVDPFRYSAYDFPVTKALTTGTTLASCKAAIDTAITTGTTIVFMGHMFAEEAAAETWVTADFQALIDYAVQRKIKCVTIDEFDKGLTNPRYRSLPLTRA
jgi:peptidoglycan/xylan/chitin deacetylase (PgdA/CDA1 family)